MEEHGRTITRNEKDRAIKLIKKYFWFSSLREFIFYLVIIILILTGHIYGYKAGLNNGMVEICENQDKLLVYIDEEYNCYTENQLNQPFNNYNLPELSLESMQ